MNLSHRYISGRQLPDKAISVLDTACAKVALGQNAVPAALEERAKRLERLSAEAAKTYETRRLRALGIGSLKRSPLLPQVPTIAEQGFAGFEAVSWYALMAPATTPREVVDKLHAEMTRAVARAEMKERFAAQGMEAGSGTPTQLAARIAAESARWAEVVRRSGAKIE